MSKSGVISAIVVLLLSVVALGAIPSCAVSAKGPNFFPGDEVWVEGPGFYDPICSEATIGLKSPKGKVCYPASLTLNNWMTEGVVVPKNGVKGPSSFFQYGKVRVEVDYDGSTFHGEPVTAWFSEKDLRLIKRAPRLLRLLLIQK